MAFQTQKNHALITGASSGIGLELANMFAKNKHNLVLVARSRDILEKLKRDLEARYQVQVLVIGQDLSQPQAAQKIMSAVREQGIQVEILVNNAGFGNYGFFAKSSLLKEIEMIQVNITALTELTKLFLLSMLERKNGKIMNVASTAAFQAGPLMAVYYATKAYVLSFSEALSEELVGTPVSVTCLCPGLTASGFQKAAALEKSNLEKSATIATSKDVAEFGYKALMNGERLAIHGALNKALVFSNRIMPRALIAKAVKKIQSERDK